jgi:hypothetical protein
VTFICVLFSPHKIGGFAEIDASLTVVWVQLLMTGEKDVGNIFCGAQDASAFKDWS